MSAGSSTDRSHFNASYAPADHSLVLLSVSECHARPEYRGKSWSDVSSHLKKGWSGHGDYAAYEPYIKNAWERRASHAAQAGGEAVVPVVEEELRVGKRKVEKRGVKARKTVAEAPDE